MNFVLNFIILVISTLGLKTWAAGVGWGDDVNMKKCLCAFAAKEDRTCEFPGNKDSDSTTGLFNDWLATYKNLNVIMDYRKRSFSFEKSFGDPAEKTFFTEAGSRTEVKPMTQGHKPTRGELSDVTSFVYAARLLFLYPDVGPNKEKYLSVIQACAAMKAENESPTVFPGTGFACISAAARNIVGQMCSQPNGSISSGSNCRPSVSIPQPGSRGCAVRADVNFDIVGGINDGALFCGENLEDRVTCSEPKVPKFHSDGLSSEASTPRKVAKPPPPPANSTVR
jgi:hypothetical protein